MTNKILVFLILCLLISCNSKSKNEIQNNIQDNNVFVSTDIVNEVLINQAEEHDISIENSEKNKESNVVMEENNGLTDTIIDSTDECDFIKMVKDEIKNIETNSVLKPNEARRVIEEQNQDVILALKDKDSEKLSTLTHPEKGILFSPLVIINPENHIVFKQEQMKTFFDDDTKYSWGIFDPPVNASNLTPDEYYEKYIFNFDYSNPEMIAYNQRLTPAVYTTEQKLTTLYIEPIIVEHLLSDENCMPYSLRIVYEKYKEEWFVVAFLHYEWTM